MELEEQSGIDTWRGAAEEVRFCYSGGGRLQGRGLRLKIFWREILRELWGMLVGEKLREGDLWS